MEEQIQLVINKIIRVALLVNGATKHHIFINFSGHVNIFEVSAHENGWIEGTSPTKKIVARLYHKTADKALDEMLNYLTDLYMSEVQKVLLEGSEINV